MLQFVISAGSKKMGSLIGEIIVLEYTASLFYSGAVALILSYNLCYVMLQFH